MTRKAKFKATEITKITANFPKELWKELRWRALDDEETVTDILVRLATNYVKKSKTK